MGVYENAPKVYFDNTGKPAGLFVDVIEEIAKREGWSIDYLKVNWDSGMRLLETGEIDLMPDVALTPDRAQVYLFHETSVLSSWSEVYLPRNELASSFLDLDGKRVSTLAGSIQEKVVSDLAKDFDIQVQLSTYRSFEDAFKAVASGRADAVVANYFIGKDLAAKYKMLPSSVIFNPVRLFFATGKGTGNDSVLLTIDKHLNQMKSDPQSIYYASLKKLYREPVSIVVPPWIKVSLLIIVPILLISMIASIILKRQVDIRTSELRIINHEMEQRIIDRTKELSIAMQKAQEADKLKSAFLAIMSHELRTPLNSIIGFTGIILQELAGPLNQEQKKQLNMVRKSSRHLLSLINDVLDISKIEAGQLDLIQEIFSLRDSISHAIDAVKPMAETKGLELKTIIDNEIDTVLGDRRRIEQVLLNLLSNAVKFTQSGSVLLKCKKAEGWVEICVQDTGIGISDDDAEKLFEPFSQVDTGLTRKYDGTGLGLSICRKLLELMGGSITVDSEPGIGSTFSLRFPMKQEETDAV